MWKPSYHLANKSNENLEVTEEQNVVLNDYLATELPVSREKPLTVVELKISRKLGNKRETIRDGKLLHGDTKLINTHARAHTYTEIETQTAN